MNAEPGRPEPSPVYARVPETVSSACESLLGEYVAGLGVRPVPERMEVLCGSDAALFAEALALEALALLAERRGEVLDLYFAQLPAGEQVETLNPAMPDLVAFLRARLLGQDPVLRVPADTPPVGPTLVLIAGQAIVEAGRDRREAMHTVLGRLRHCPVELRVPSGDLGYALDDADGHPPDQVRRDQVRSMLTGAVPLSAAGLADERLWLALDLAARPDIRDLMRIFAVDPLPGGADTRTEWLLLPGAPALVRLTIDCLEPVLVRFAIAFDVDRHGEVLREAARTDHVFVVGREPGSGPRSRNACPRCSCPTTAAAWPGCWPTSPRSTTTPAHPDPGTRAGPQHRSGRVAARLSGHPVAFASSGQVL